MACDVLGDNRGPVRCLNELDAALVTEFKEDLGRYRAYGESYRRILFNPAVWCIFWYRLGRWVYSPDRNLLVRCLGKPLHLIGATWIEAFLQTLHPEVVIGRHRDIAHHVTLGTRGAGSQGAPKLGNNVYGGTNAVLIGPIRVEDGARIAANSLVNRDVPAGATVMGVSAVVVKQRAVKEIAEAPEVTV
ncbi:serine O-acetyltransferase [Terriglobus sp. 2YAB30_2]|uniref:serine O-acetyltransferase n=1 Tax=unclassified Terriglobus TaxID=2628988 RepID=UPI003F99FF44